ncbi:hydantoinase/oxoprolinase family protein [Microvirga sp. VF16]|uniref:hydantoinase/oxoprolinase family protein n=1 Tax=Microvirga sp. VF16 TaxID=2807101 RepID=UPI00193D60A0|nr:hydantoinase/oxoprolinase family protein [Microvirga sp. VF16]QRM32224.1 hydantoinase/oxoprolinase family protein [Microvirga sp. VF16]
MDVGGTFTDLVLIDADGFLLPIKSPSNPANPALGVLRAVDRCAEQLGMTAEQLLQGCSSFVHGTTVATNILLERNGANVGLLVTSGFRDTLEIRRGYRELPWDHRSPWQDVIVPRKLRIAVEERLRSDGSVVTPLDERTIYEAARIFEQNHIQSIAICFLHSYRNPAHEDRCGEILERVLPRTFISKSSSLAPILGEFERTSTAVANAYIAPKVIPYLTQLNSELRRRGLDNEMLLVQSNGGAVPVKQITEQPITLALSGPAAGLASLKLYSQIHKADNLISIEIGGTSCDVTMINGGRVAEVEALKVDDTLVALPSVDIHTIGTGGGTVCGVDNGGFLFAGPEGAGARPGPACYGLGGTRPTVTDAQLVLGRLHSGQYAGGALQLDAALATKAIDDGIGSPLGLNTIAAASAAIQLVEQNIRQAVEKVSLVRGFDPANFSLVGVGGAGPLHVAEVARRLGIRTALVPRLAGVFCALGMCTAGVRYDFVRVVGTALDDTLIISLLDGFNDLERQARSKLSESGMEFTDIEVMRSVSMRYEGQQSVIKVPFDQADVACVTRYFETLYEKQYASIQRDARVEIVYQHVTAIGGLPSSGLKARSARQGHAAQASSRRQVYVSGALPGVYDVPVLKGADLETGHFFDGPAVIDESTTTIVIGEGDRIEVDRYGDYIIRVNAPERL